jgi:hypothetical protein
MGNVWGRGSGSHGRARDGPRLNFRRAVSIIFLRDSEDAEHGEMMRVGAEAQSPVGGQGDADRGRVLAHRESHLRKWEGQSPPDEILSLD